MDYLFREIMKFAENNLVESGLIIIFALVVSFLAHRMIDVLFHYQRQIGRYKKSEELQKRSRTISRMVKTGLDIAIWIYVSLAVLQNFGVDVAKLTTGAGLIGALIGFGAQNTIRDILAGIFIVLENQYRVGDTIEKYADGRRIVGRVENVSLRITQVRDRDGKLHTIRNGANESVTNMSFRYANINFTVGVAYATDIDFLEQVVNAVGQKMAEKDMPYAKYILEPIHFARVNRFLDSEIEINCIGRVKAGQQWDITGEFRRMLKKAFDENGIEFPFPQVVVHDHTSMSSKLAKQAAAAQASKASREKQQEK